MGLKPKPVRDSQIEVTHIVQPTHTNALGTIFGGHLMAWIDTAAAIGAERHARRVCVTASMDDLHFLAPVRAGNIVILKASVNYTHRTSMEVGVKAEGEDPLTGRRWHTASAYLTFVAIDRKCRPVPLPPVRPQSPAEKRRFREAGERRNLRLARRP